ncbi:NAD(P)H-dependent FMN reductase [Sphingobium sp. B2D3A]|uniref:NADPH-dependent FMN reductase n=1 Tax=Sphingobium TaxID=165695 RepID=UPI0015EB5CE9|nr:MULTISPECIES: NAD(P)H-dependent oxidoreductase [Sphingobium]MCW2336266.1 NAD(P)H-dependent FMN reductase [Sphingobium sp. B2D3A]MCW2363624.1 NAD(P)H-dependent FMN reductase [Sphingobium sp. B10D3B]MCW2386021.1 NAD(P)H-dependent FMN reductase [Sphingobium sp. B2D3D]MCW2402978.1 NAD(P)H-dependent FMN reductase [Sphingobium sp. B10D7B]MCW2409956.1 NAD(P)H-dependent FMN reductase [Sphingobium xanthum]
MSLSLLVFYGSYREARAGIRLADYCVRTLSERGHKVELIDARAVGLPMLDKRLSDYAPGTAPAEMTALADKISAADGFVFVTGEYNSGLQPGLKNLIDHYYQEWRRRPAGIVSYSAGRMAGARSSYAWHPTLTTLGIAVIPASVAVGGITDSLDAAGEPSGAGGAALVRSFTGFAEELEWWAGAVKAQRKPG